MSIKAVQKWDGMGYGYGLEVFRGLVILNTSESASVSSVRSWPITARVVFVSTNQKLLQSCESNTKWSPSHHHYSCQVIPHSFLFY